MLLACGLRGHEIAELTVDHLQKREEHWAIIDVIGEGGHIRTIPVPDWVYRLLNDWIVAAGIQAGKLFRKVSSEPLNYSVFVFAFASLYLGLSQDVE
jgi:integrase